MAADRHRPQGHRRHLLIPQQIQGRLLLPQMFQGKLRSRGSEKKLISYEPMVISERRRKG